MDAAGQARAGNQDGTNLAAPRHGRRVGLGRLFQVGFVSMRSEFIFNTSVLKIKVGRVRRAILHAAPALYADGNLHRVEKNDGMTSMVEPQTRRHICKVLEKLTPGPGEL
jgi:hypothetical protein